MWLAKRRSSWSMTIFPLWHKLSLLMWEWNITHHMILNSNNFFMYYFLNSEHAWMNIAILIWFYWIYIFKLYSCLHDKTGIINNFIIVTMPHQQKSWNVYNSSFCRWNDCPQIGHKVDHTYFPHQNKVQVLLLKSMSTICHSFMHMKMFGKSLWMHPVLLSKSFKLDFLKYFISHIRYNKNLLVC